VAVVVVVVWGDRKREVHTTAVTCAPAPAALM
jgi:hypothetical protein